MKITNQNLLDNKKEELKNLANQYKEAITEEVEELRDKSEEMGKKALVIGSVLLVGYCISRLISSSSTKNEKPEEREEKEFVKSDQLSRPSIKDEISRAIMTQITMFLLGIAKEKLSRFLNQQLSNSLGKTPETTTHESTTTTTEEF